MIKRSKNPSKKHFALGVMLVVTLVLVVGCGGQAAELTEESLKNAEYQGIYPQEVKLTDGQYEGEPFVEGGASRPTVLFIEPYAVGDLDGDGLNDAAVLLVENSGGSGSFVYLAAVLNRDGQPENVATTFLGDRAQVEELAIKSGKIALTMLTHGPEDPLCCPTQEVQQTYTLEGNQLMLQGG